VLHLDAAEADLQGAERPAERHGVLEDALELVGSRRRAQVDVVRLFAEREIAHGAADDPRAVPEARDTRGDLARGAAPDPAAASAPRAPAGEPEGRCIALEA
jgi:hypothetical protein